MINIIWIIIIVISIIYSLFTGMSDEVTATILRLSTESFTIFAGIAALIILWSGILEIAERGGFLAFLTGKLNKVVKHLFSKNISQEALDLACGNIACNFLGLGSAATPLGVKAMQKLQEENTTPDRLSYNQSVLIIFNICGVSLFPTSLVALRESFSAKNNINLVFPILALSVVVLVVLLLINSLLSKWQIT